MKKLFNYLFILGIMLIPVTTKATTGVFDIYASTKEVIVGNNTTITVHCNSSVSRTCEYILSYDSSKLKFLNALDSTNCNGIHCAYFTGDLDSPKSFNFKVIAAGTSTVSVISSGMIDVDENNISTSIDAVNVKGYIPSSNQSSNSGSSSSGSSSSSTSYSTNNNLSSLTIEGQKLSPDFNKDTTSYNVELESSIEEINIVATVEDSKANIAGIGNVKVNEGENKIEIIVTSEKGTTKTYTILANVKDTNPIIVTLDKEKYTIVKRISAVKAPDSYTEKKITIDKQEIKALYSETTKYTLVGLKNSKGNINLYIYNSKDNSYILYQEIESPSIKLVINKCKTINKYFKEVEITINNNKVKAYTYNDIKNYYYLYGTNIKTNKTAWYRYEKTEGTIQLFDLNDFKNNDKKKDDANMLIYILGGTIILLSTFLIVMACNNKKRNSKTDNKKVPKYLEKTIKIDNDTKEEVKEDEIKEDIKEKQKENKTNNKKNKKSKDLFSNL